MLSVLDPLQQGIGRGRLIEGQGGIVISDDDITNALFEFSDIAGPGIVGGEMLVDPCDDFGSNVLSFIGEEAIDDHGDEVMDGGGAVVELLAEAGCVDSISAKPVEQVESKSSLGDLDGEIAVGGGDELAFEAAECCLADAAEVAVLNDAEDLDLYGEVEFSNFVEEDGSGGLAALKPTLMIAGGAGKAPFLVAEEFGFDERGREGGEVEWPEALLGIVNELQGLDIEGDILSQANGTGDEFFACAGWSGD